MGSVWHGLLHALGIAGSMTWQVTWSLILGFTLSAVIEALVKKSTIARLMPDDSPKSLATATALGAASSSCSYAAVALARALVRKGANFTAAMAFQFASTNLVIELGLILALLLGWQFTAAEFAGGPFMIVLLALIFRRFLSSKMVDEARQQADRAVAGSMEGHAAMDMSVGGQGSFWQRLLSPAGFTSVSHNFVMGWAAVLRDIVLGLLLAGVAAAWIPDTFWQNLFFTGHPLAGKIWGPIIGPLVAVVTFVCSIGNVPLAAVLWNGGISFGGVVSFIFADLIIVPIIVIYAKYYGRRMAVFLTGTFYVTMVAAGYVIELVFTPLHLTPRGARRGSIGANGISWNYTTWLDIVFLLLAVVLVRRFFTTGGREMLAMMGGGPGDVASGHENLETCRVAADPVDYQRYGLAKAEVAVWEDGFRTRPGGPGTFEWWYFDAVLEDSSTLVINFMVKDIRGGGGIRQPARPVVTFELDRLDGTHVERALHAHDDFAFASDRCDVRVGTNTFAGDLRTYRIHLDIEGVTADVTLTGQVPSWRPETGHILFGDDQPHLFAWLPSVPQGSVQATLTVDGETRRLTGTGYHDHNWGDAEMPRLIHHWYWARAEAGGYCVIASNITAERRYGHAEVPICLLAKDGKVLADDSSLVRFEKVDEHPDPITGKPVADTTVYDYDATAHGGEHYRITFRRDNTIVQDRMIESVTGPRRILAKLAGFDGAYMRFTGQVTVDHIGGPAHGTVTAPALWELMYFGKTTV